MRFELKRETGVPLYIQVKNQIKENIEQGIWTPGSKIPTERSLAQELNISRNTVSMAFRELEAEGILVCQQGRGTFIAESDEAVRRESRKERLLKIIDIAMEEATTLGFNLDEFLAITHVRAREKQEILSNVNIVLIECNREQVEYFARELAHSVGVIVQPIILNELQRQPDKFQSILQKADIIITTLFHLQPVREIVGKIDTEIIALALSPLLDSIVRIARLPNGSNVGIFCTSYLFADKMIASLRNAGITHLRFERFLGAENPSELEEQVASVDYVITSPSRKTELAGPARALGKGEVIEFIYSPDQASIDLLKSTVLELKQKNLKKWE
ncbi:MAG: GntR family transcriptional regulator [Firmicutes bacterium]|nr:GntR family transcriptional regulator [Bacillota bacterium]